MCFYVNYMIMQIRSSTRLLDTGRCYHLKNIFNWQFHQLLQVMRYNGFYYLSFTTVFFFEIFYWFCCEIIITCQLTFLSTNATDGLSLSQLYQQLLELHSMLTWAMCPLFSSLLHLPQWLVMLSLPYCYILRLW